MRIGGVGGLYARVQFNLKSEKGKEAFSNVVFFGEEQEWSIGYKTLNADFDSQRQANLLREVELYEVSPVLHGANQLTATISIKADAPNELSVGDLVTWSASGGEAYGKVVKKATSGSISAEPEGPEMEGTKEKPAIAVQVWKRKPSGEWDPTTTTTVHRMDHLRQIDALPATKSAKPEDRVTSFGKSKWKMFDRAFAERIKSDHPEIWDAGGNIKGDDQYTILTRIAEQGGIAKTEDQINALELREAWIARHKGDFRLPGVIAQIKWLAIGSRDEAYMKNVVNDAIKSKKNDPAGYNPATGRAAEIAKALSEKLSGPVKLVEIRDNEVDFEFNDEMWTSSWASPGDNGIVFGDIQPMTQVMGPKGNTAKKGFMPEVSISLLPQKPEDLAVKGGYAPEDIHMIIKKMGYPEDWTKEQQSIVEDTVEKWAMGMGRPVMGAIRFAGHDEEDENHYEENEKPMGYRMRIPEAEVLRSQVSEVSPYPTSDRQDAQYEALETVAEKFGKWDQGVGADGAHYVESSPFKSEGLVCSNCVYYKGPRGCEVVAGDIAPNGVCKLWIIPEDLVKKPKSEKGAMAPDFMISEDETEVQSVKNHWNPFMPIGVGVQQPEGYSRIVPFDRVRINWGPQQSRDFYIGDKPEQGCGCGCGGKDDYSSQVSEKVSLTDVPGAESNTNIGGDVLRGRGPRRGNLEALLRYWRPIMKRTGGFRRCVAELSDHPELAPWKPLCAWLHHETTGKWPNEGHHHGGGRGGGIAKRVLRGRKTGWSEEYGIKSMDIEPDGQMPTEEELKWAYKIMSHFADQEPEFVKYLQDPKSWVLVNEKNEEFEMEDWKEWISSDDGEPSPEMGVKVGRQLSSRNLTKLKQATDLINQVLAASEIMQKTEETVLIAVTPETAFEVKQLLDPIAEYYGTEISIDEISGESVSIDVISDEQHHAIDLAMKSLIPVDTESKSVVGIDEKGMPIKPKKQKLPQKTRATGSNAVGRYFHPAVAEMKATETVAGESKPAQETSEPTVDTSKEPIQTLKEKIGKAISEVKPEDPKKLQENIAKLLSAEKMTSADIPFLAGRDETKNVVAGALLTQDDIDEIRLAQKVIGDEAKISIAELSAIDDISQLDELNQMIIKENKPSLMSFILAELVRMEKQVRQFELAKEKQTSAQNWQLQITEGLSRYAKYRPIKNVSKIQMHDFRQRPREAMLWMSQHQRLHE